MANKVILTGHLGQDPELRYTPSGTAVCNFSLATTKKFKNKQGERQEETQWHNITAWSGLAETCGKYLGKGSKVYVEGELTYDKYEKDGVNVIKAVIVIREMEFLSAPREDGNAGQQRPPAQNSAGGTGQRRWQAPAEQPPFNPDDDIPF